MLKISKCLIEYKDRPIDLDVQKPRFSWKLESKNQNVTQRAYQITVSTENTVVWDSGKIYDCQSVHVEYDGKPLEPMTVYSIFLTVWDNYGETASTGTNMETGLLSYKNISAEWITHALDANEEACPVFKKEFSLKKEISSARIYSTALGVYELELNGRRVSDEYFSPGWTSYNNRLQYQTYDIAGYLKESNELKATVANGWYKGNLAYEGRINIYGDRAAILLEIHLYYCDGSSEIFTTDDSWKYTTGEIRYSEIYHGETIDKTYEIKEWLPVKKYSHEKNMIMAQECEPVRIIQKLPAVELIHTPKGEAVIDFGQNLTGFVEFECDCKKGKKIVFRHAEILDKHGNFYIDNIRAAKATDTFVCSGENEIYKPHFTFHGFRYLHIQGMERNIDISKFRACVLHTDMELTGHFECSDELVNQLQHNIQWGQRGNFLDVPTDCPQRDERLGWTGDAQVFARTSAFNFNVASFFTKWLRDLEADQGKNGEVPFVVPDALIKEDGKVNCSAAWGDAATIVPWTMYLCYEDTRLLKQQYSSMKEWVDCLKNEAGDSFLWNTGFHFGDWLGLDMEQFFTWQKFSADSASGSTDKYYIASAFFAYSTELLAESAKILGYTEEAKSYSKLHKSIVKAFRNEYITPNGRLMCETQTGMLLALKFRLIDEKHRTALADRLADNLKRHNMQMVTGFVGASYLCMVLSENGHHDLAGKLLLQTECPSWLYPVTKGATTIWERWNGIKPDGEFETPEMNSFNHYAYGAIGDWMYRKILGIEAIEPGYKKISIAPMPVEGLDFTKGHLNTMYGKISVEWKRKNNGFFVDVAIPVNCSALVKLPGKNEIIKIGSGEYHFEQ